MFKDLFVATTGQGDDAATPSIACALAEANGGHVAVRVQASVPNPGSAPSTSSGAAHE